MHKPYIRYIVVVCYLAILKVRNPQYFMGLDI